MRLKLDRLNTLWNQDVSDVITARIDGVWRQRERLEEVRLELPPIRTAEGRWRDVSQDCCAELCLPEVLRLLSGFLNIAT